MEENEIKIVSYRIDYIGTSPPSLEDIEDAIVESELDLEGICTVEEAEPIYEMCEACDGVGNCDEAAGFSLDCAECGGSGWITIKEDKKKKDRKNGK